MRRMYSTFIFKLLSEMLVLPVSVFVHDTLLHIHRVTSTGATEV